MSCAVTSAAQQPRGVSLLGAAPFAANPSSSCAASAQLPMPPISLQLQQQNRSNHHYTNPNGATPSATCPPDRGGATQEASHNTYHHHSCRAAAADYHVTSLEDPIQLLANEFRQVHRIGVARYTFRSQQQLVKVGPGSYNVEKGQQLTSPSSTHWTIASKSPRMGLVTKTLDEQRHDDALSRRENIKSFHKYFSRAILAKQQQQQQRLGSPTTGLRAAEDAENAMLEASPRWMRPTSSTTQRRHTVQEQAATVAKAAAAAPLPMKFASNGCVAATCEEDDHQHQHKHAKNKPSVDGSEVAKTQPSSSSSAAAANPTPPAPPPRPPLRQHHKANTNPTVVITDEDRLESFRKTLTRPSSATVRYSANSPHWLNGCVKDCSVAGVAVGNPRDGKTDAMYNVVPSSEATRVASPRISMGTSPRFPGEKPCPPPHKQPQRQRPQSARLRGAAEALSSGTVSTAAV
jgi:hypothetical protein